MCTTGDWKLNMQYTNPAYSAASPAWLDTGSAGRHSWRTWIGNKFICVFGPGYYALLSRKSPVLLLRRLIGSSNTGDFLKQTWNVAHLAQPGRYDSIAD